MNSNILIVIAASAIFYGTPLFFAALGGVFTERSGVLNLGVEGMMLIGGVTGAWASLHIGGSAWFTVLAALCVAMAAGAVLAALHAFLCVTLKANQTVAGLSITIFAGAVGLSSYFANIWKVAENPVTRQVRKLDVLGLADTPILGPLLFNHTILTYASWVMCAVASWYLFRTKIGLQLRAVGERLVQDAAERRRPGRASVRGVAPPHAVGQRHRHGLSTARVDSIVAILVTLDGALYRCRTGPFGKLHRHLLLR